MVVARFSVWKSFPIEGFLLLGCAGMLWYDATTGAWKKGPWEMYGDLIFCLGVVTQISMFTKLIRYHRRAVWIENGKLWFVHPWQRYYDQRYNIADIAALTQVRRIHNGIEITLRDGSKVGIPTWLLSEKPGVVLDHLKIAIPAAVVAVEPKPANNGW